MEKPEKQEQEKLHKKEFFLRGKGSTAIITGPFVIGMRAQSNITTRVMLRFALERRVPISNDDSKGEIPANSDDIGIKEPTLSLGGKRTTYYFGTNKEIEIKFIPKDQDGRTPRFVVSSDAPISVETKDDPFYDLRTGVLARIIAKERKAISP